MRQNRYNYILPRIQIKIKKSRVIIYGLCSEEVETVGYILDGLIATQSTLLTHSLILLFFKYHVHHIEPR